MHTSSLSSFILSLPHLPRLLGPFCEISLAASFCAPSPSPDLTPSSLLPKGFVVLEEPWEDSRAHVSLPVSTLSGPVIPRSAQNTLACRARGGEGAPSVVPEWGGL